MMETGTQTPDGMGRRASGDGAGTYRSTLRYRPGLANGAFLELRSIAGMATSGGTRT